jgi:hypothetical protein
LFTYVVAYYEKTTDGSGGGTLYIQGQAFDFDDRDDLASLFKGTVWGEHNIQLWEGQQQVLRTILPASLRPNRVLVLKGTRFTLLPRTGSTNTISSQEQPHKANTDQDAPKAPPPSEVKSVKTTLVSFKQSGGKKDSVSTTSEPTTTQFSVFTRATPNVNPFTVVPSFGGGSDLDNRRVSHLLSSTDRELLHELASEMGVEASGNNGKSTILVYFLICLGLISQQRKTSPTPPASPRVQPPQHQTPPASPRVELQGQIQTQSHTQPSQIQVHIQVQPQGQSPRENPTSSPLSNSAKNNLQGGRTSHIIAPPVSPRRLVVNSPKSPAPASPRGNYSTTTASVTTTAPVVTSPVSNPSVSNPSEPTSVVAPSVSPTRSPGPSSLPGWSSSSGGGGVSSSSSVATTLSIETPQIISQSFSPSSTSPRTSEPSRTISPRSNPSTSTQGGNNNNNKNKLDKKQNRKSTKNAKKNKKSDHDKKEEKNSKKEDPLSKSEGHTPSKKSAITPKKEIVTSNSDDEDESPAPLPIKQKPSTSTKIKPSKGDKLYSSSGGIKQSQPKANHEKDQEDDLEKTEGKLYLFWFYMFRYWRTHEKGIFTGFCLTWVVFSKAPSPPPFKVKFK